MEPKGQWMTKRKGSIDPTWPEWDNTLSCAKVQVHTLHIMESTAHYTFAQKHTKAHKATQHPSPQRAGLGCVPCWRETSLHPFEYNVLAEGVAWHKNGASHSEKVSNTQVGDKPRVFWRWSVRCRRGMKGVGGRGLTLL